MNTQIVAVIFQEGGRLLSELIRTRPKRTVVEHPPTTTTPIEPQEIAEESKASSIEAGCVPCAIGHFGTCTGLLNEAMRFAKKDGVSSSEVIDRVNMCLDELNSMERVDLRAELIVDLPEWEKELADKALIASRTTRHGLESITSVATLEKVTANTQTARQEIGRAWFKKRLAEMPEEAKAEIEKQVAEKLVKE